MKNKTVTILLFFICFLASEVFAATYDFGHKQDLTWGVLTVNTNKSIYLPGEEVFFSMAVLNDKGKMVTEANISLEIISPSQKRTHLSTQEGTIIINPECWIYGKTDKPDYEASYKVTEIGKYRITLIATTPNGIRSIIDTFEVRENVPFNIERQGPTRIFPPESYTMTLIIEANEDYQGLVIENVPSTFNILPQDNLSIEVNGNVKVLSFNVNFVKGKSYQLKYQFKAPNISPYFYLLGAFQIGDFEEHRQWQIAGDAAPTYHLFTEGKATTGNSVSCNKPSGVVEDDLMIACYTTDGSRTHTSPGGWTIINQGKSGTAATVSVWYKIATNSEGPSYTFDCGFSEHQYIFIIRITGHDLINPVNVSGVNTGSSNSSQCSDVTTTLDDCLILRVTGQDDDDITVDSGYPGSHTGITMDKSGAAATSCSGGAAYTTQASTGGTGTANFSLTASEQWRALTIAISPLQPPPDLTLTSSDIVFSNDYPALNEVITITATIYNEGGRDFQFDNYESGGNANFYVKNTQWISQQFYVPCNLRLTRVSLYIQDEGASDNITVEIRNNDVNKPAAGAANLLATKILDSDFTSFGWQDFVFDDPPQLSTGTKYWICAENSNATDTDSYLWKGEESSPYDEGGISSDQGTSWSHVDNYCFYFRAYEDVLVQFFDGNPDSGGTQIGTDQFVSPDTFSSEDCLVSWTAAPAGEHNIYVWVDTANFITESNETNNKTFKTIVVDTITPSAITDLTALAYGEAQEIKLSWTAPGDDGTVGDNTSSAYYIVRYATFSCDTAGSTQTWWNHVNVSTYTQDWSVSSQGTLEEKILGGFESGTTYYFAIKTVDDTNNVSDIDENSLIGGNDQANAYGSTSPPISPCAISNLTALTGEAPRTIKLQWTAPGDDGQGGGNCAGYEVRYSLLNQITTANYSDATVYSDASSWVPVNYGTEENRVVSGLIPGATYWFAIKAYDNNSNYGSWSSEPYTSEQNKAAANDEYMYYVSSSAPNDIGVPGGDPNVLENCWQTIGQAFSDLKTNESNDLTGKGQFVIQIQNSADYDEGIELNNLTTTADDTLIIRAALGERPTWKNNSSIVLFHHDPSVDSYGALKISIPHVTIQGINFTGTSADVEKAHGIMLSADTCTIRNCIFHDLTNNQGDYNHNANAIFQAYSSDKIGHKIYNNTFYNVITCIRFSSVESVIFEVRNNIFCVNNCSAQIEQAFLTAGDFEDGNPDSNYNIFHIASGNRLAYDWGSEWGDGDGIPETYTTLVDWKAAFTPNPDQNSLSSDPKFVTPGTDFHLKSTNGHWTDSGWEKDGETSPCIDTGAPYSSGTEYTYYENEPEDNGDRVNMGVYANTDQASASGELAPDAPAELTQYESDGITEISAGDDTDEETVVFKSTVTDPTGDQVKLEVEVKECGVSFDGTETSTSSLVASGNVATTTNTFSEGSYHWRARTIDEYASSSTWVCFGTDPDDINEIDFIVNIPPAAISNLTALTGDNDGEVTLNWTAPGDDETDGTVTTYIVKYATNQINNADFYASYVTTFTHSWSDFSVGGSTDTRTVTGLTLETTYYFAIKGVDEVNNYGVWNSSDDAGVNILNFCMVNISPSAITTLTALAEDDGNVKLSWIAPGDDGTTGDITDGKFRIRWSTYNVSDWDNGSWDDWENKYSIDIDTSCSPFSTHSETITGLTGGSTYYFRIWTADEILNWSELSNGATCQVSYGIFWHSISSGNWTNGSVWDKGIAPQSQSIVVITHTVTYNQLSTDVTCSSITIENLGTLQFDVGNDTRTLVVHGNIDIKSGGKFLMEPNTGYMSIVKIKCENDEKYGITVEDGGIFDVRGSSMAYWRTTYNSGLGTTVSPLELNDDVGWKVNDMITVGPSTATTTGVEERYIKTIVQTSPYQVTLSTYIGGEECGLNEEGWHLNGDEVVNITRNCVITSYNTDGSHNSYIRNLSQTEANFNMEWVEVSYLGKNELGKYGITYDGSGTRGKIDYCSIHNGYWGIYLNSSSNNTISNSSCYSNSYYGIYLPNSSNNTMSNNTCYSNSNHGIYLWNSSDNTMSNNTCYSNSWYGIYLWNSSDNNTISNNSCYSNDCGIRIYNSCNNNTLSNNTCYSNSNYGIRTRDSINNTVINCRLGPNNTTGDIGYESGKVSKLVLKDCELNSLTKVDTGEIDTLGSYLISYNQNNSTGTVRVWGDYDISDTQKFNYSDLLYVSTATKPNSTLKGTGSITYPTTDDGKTQTEFWEIKCTDDTGTGHFSVKRGTGTSLTTDPLSPAEENSTFTSNSRGVTFKVNTDNYEIGDSFYFVTISSSADQNIRKKIEFGKCSIDSLGNKSKLTVQEGGKIELVGESGYETEISTCEAGYYIFEIAGTVSSSATIKAEHFKFNYSTGIILGQYITIEKFNNGKFHDTGNNYHVKTKAVDLINSSTYFYGLSFDDTGDHDFSVQDGSSIEVRLPFVRGNYDDEVEPGSFIHWNTSPTSITNLTALTGDNSGEVKLSWTAPREDTTQGNLVNIVNGKYGIKYSTYMEYDFDGAENFDVEWDTSTVYGESQTKVVTGLIYETTYYFRIWAKDRTNLWSEISNGATSWCNISPAAITTLTALAEDDGEVTLSWTAPGDDGTTGDITDGKFRIRWSTYNVSIWESDWDNGSWNDWENKYSLDIDTTCSPFSTHSETITGLTGGSTYYFRIWTADELLNWSELSNGATCWCEYESGQWWSVQNGSWTVNSTWDKGYPPNPLSVVHISHTVTYNQLSTDVTCSSITIENLGTLKFDVGNDTRTLVVHGNIDIKSGGKFLMEPNTGYMSIVKIKCVDDEKYGIIVRNNGVFDVRGSSMSFWRTGYDETSNGTTLVVTDSVDWKVGDYVTVATSDTDKDHTEEVEITGKASASEYTVSPALTDEWHGQNSEVVNITRNCKITSYDTLKKAYIVNYSTTEANFNMEWVEVSYLGRDEFPKYGIYFHGAVGAIVHGKINYCSIHNGYYGIYLFRSSDNTMSNNTCYLNSYYGIRIYFHSDNNTMSNNTCYSNSESGICLHASSDNTLSNNACYSNFWFGIYLHTGSDNTLSNNTCYSNNYYGIQVYSSNNTMSNNTCYSNSRGINLSDSFDNTLNNNTCYSNLYDGIYLYINSDNNTLSNNTCYSNSLYGIRLHSSSNNTISNNTCYSNSLYGIFTKDSINNTVINCKLGPNNTTGDIGYESDKVSKLVLKDCELKSLIKVDTGEIDTSGSYLISYNQNNSTGAVQIWGDYDISDTQKFNYSDLLYVSTATKPNSTLKGTGSITYPTTDDGKTQTEFWEVKCTDDTGTGHFSVKRGTGTSLTTDPASPAEENSTFTSDSRGVTFKVNTDNYEIGDAFYFITISSSSDQNIQKKIEFGQCSIDSLGNKSKLTVKQGGKIELIGESGYETEISTCEAGYYIFEITGTISSDAYIKAEHFKFNYSTGVILGQYITIEKFNNGEFCNTGNNYHVKTKAVDLINAGTYFYELSFDDTGDHDFTVQDGSSIEVRLPWTRGNYDDKVEAGSFIHWNTPPTKITNLTALTGDNSGEVKLTWTAPREDTTQGNLVNIINGEYGIKYSTYTEYDFDGVENFDVEWDTSTVYGESQTKVVTGLIYETTYYFRIWAKDRTNLWSELSNGATNWCNISPSAITTLTALAESNGEVTLSWTAPGDDGTTGDITDGKFRIRWSTYNVSNWENGSWDDWKNKYSLDIDSTCSSLSAQSHVVTGLTGGSTYYFRIWTADELLNWSELSNGATTTVKIIYGVDITTVNINFTYYEAGGSTVIPSAVPVKSISNVVSNFAVLAVTGTAGTPWQISDMPGLDKITIYCVINSTKPSITNFKDEDKLTSSYQACTNTKFSMGYEDGVEVEAGGIRNTWYLIKFPLASNTTAQQSIIINFKAQKP